MMNKDSRIFIAGQTGLVGSAINKYLIENGYKNILSATHKDLDMLDTNAVDKFFELNKPEYVFLAAGKVGGIVGNSKFPADYIYENLEIVTNVINSAHKYKVTKLLFLGSSCIYPRECPQPIKEEYLMTGPLEQTNEGYALAKIAGLMLCKKYKEQYGDNFISAMPTNLYGPKDNYHPEYSHVIPGLIRRFVEARDNNLPEVVIWGTGKPLREFLFVDDLAEALVFLMNNYDGLEHINVGTGEDITIKQLAEIIKEVTNYKGLLRFDTSRPDGTPRKLLDVTKINNLGWKHKTSFIEGLKVAVDWYESNVKNQQTK